jgi:glutamate N-acetyltransferase/amino-acid N-acetyltransferase
LTTDTHIKVSTRTLTVNGQEIRLTGFAKGAAMIGPNMATLLAFVLTDAAVAPATLQALAARAAGQTFNCISVEGHTSTNDTLLLFANGQGVQLEGAALAPFEQALTVVCSDLARAIAGDAEGATHLIAIQVEGLRNDREAWRVAKAVADSALVKTAIFGADPNWGRIVSAAGYAGVAFEESQLSLWLGENLLYENGTPLPFDAGEVSAWIKNNRELTMRLLFHLGSGQCTFYTCDLSYDYVRINAEYTT